MPKKPGRGYIDTTVGPPPPPPKPKWQQYLDEFLEDPIEEPEIPEDETLGDLSISESEELRAALAELASREVEALRLYEPMPEQERFHASQSPTRIVIGGNRGGKTLATMVEVARAVTGQDPHRKYSPGNGIAILVGKTLRHCGLVLYPLLFKPGAFKVIRDPDTGVTRSFRPGNEWDEAHATEARPAPPLIPARFYKSSDIAWENKRDEIPKSIRIRGTKWKILFYSGEAAPPQGMTADLIDFDEEIVHPQWFIESRARLLDRRVEIGHGKFVNGRFIWGATPQSGTQHLYDLSEKAEGLKDNRFPSVEQFNVSLLGNIHVTEQAKAEFIQGVEQDEDEYNVRVLGHFAIAGSRVYPEFMPKGVHGCLSFPIPDNWTRYTFVDPGRQVCAVLFVALPPPSVETVEHNGQVVRVRGRKIIYGELYIKKCNATIFASRLQGYVGTTSIYAQYIDYRAGRIHEMGSGVTHEQQYTAALKKVRFRAEKTGTGFIWAADAVKEGIEAFRNGLHVVDGVSEWLVFHDKTPNLQTEMKRYCYKKVPQTNICTDEPLQRDNHLADCCRYAALAKPVYRKPTPRKHKPGTNAVILAAKKEKGRRRKKDGAGGATIKLW